MKFTCESCSAQYMISDEKVGPSGVKVRCKKCGNVIFVRRAAPPEAARPAEPAVSAEGSARAAGAEAAVVASAGGAAVAAQRAGFDAELGEALDNMFREGPAPAAAPASAAAAAPAPQPDPAASPLLGPEDAAKVFADKPSGPATTEWYVAIGQAQVGPLPLPEVKKKWEAGDVGPDSLVWRPGMADWCPLSTVTDLAGYLAPVPRPSSSARPAEPRPEPAGRVEPAAPAPAEPTWKPVGASALAALASEELAGRTGPEPKPAARATQSVKSIVDALPDGGGVDPTGALPLNIKALEATTSEKKLERRSSLAREQARHRRSSSRAVLIGLGALAIVAAAAAGGVVAYQKLARPARPVVAAAPVQVPQPPPAAAPVAAPAAAPAPVPAAAAPTAAEAPGAGLPAAPAPAKEAVAAVKEPPAAAPPRTSEAPAAPAKAAANGPRRGGKTTRVARAEPPPRHEAPPPAAAEPPARAPSGRKGSLLDFESNDRALDDALGGSTSAGGRSVYVPPAASGGSTLPAKVSPGDINAAVAQRIDSLRRCVSEQKAREPDASGTLKMRWIIHGDGSVSDVKCLTPQFAQGAFAQCISGVVKGIRFPRSATSGQEVTFPFNF